MAQVTFPGTPQERKIERIVRQALYQDIRNTGRLAIALARQVFFSNTEMRASSLGGHLGKYDVLDERKLEQIQDIIMRMYVYIGPRMARHCGQSAGRQLARNANR